MTIGNNLSRTNCSIYLMTYFTLDNPPEIYDSITHTSKSHSWHLCDKSLQIDEKDYNSHHERSLKICQIIRKGTVYIIMILHSTKRKVSFVCFLCFNKEKSNLNGDQDKLKARHCQQGWHPYDFLSFVTVSLQVE